MQVVFVGADGVFRLVCGLGVLLGCGWAVGEQTWTCGHDGLRFGTGVRVGCVSVDWYLREMSGELVDVEAWPMAADDCLNMVLLAVVYLECRCIDEKCYVISALTSSGFEFGSRLVRL